MSSCGKSLCGVYTLPAGPCATHIHRLLPAASRSDSRSPRHIRLTNRSHETHARRLRAPPLPVRLRPGRRNVSRKPATHRCLRRRRGSEVHPGQMEVQDCRTRLLVACRRQRHGIHRQHGSQPLRRRAGHGDPEVEVRYREPRDLLARRRRRNRLFRQYGRQLLRPRRG